MKNRQIVKLLTKAGVIFSNCVVLAGYQWYNKSTVSTRIYFEWLRSGRTSCSKLNELHWSKLHSKTAVEIYVLFAGTQKCCSLKSSNILKHQTRNLDNASFHECAIKESIKPLANKKLPCTSWRIKLDHYCHTFNATSKQKYVTTKGHERISCRLFFCTWLVTFDQSLLNISS